MKTPTALAFLLDVDNTLFDNDRFGKDLSARLERDFGAGERNRYWSIFADLRGEQGYADYLAALQRFRDGLADQAQLISMAQFMLEYPFAERLFPHALEVIQYLGTLGTCAIVSDGDIVFQPRKIRRSGLWDAVAGRVMVCVHKQYSLAQVQQRFPAQHYVMIDDKPQLLAAMKRILGARLTTVFVRQGHYAAAASDQAINPAPDRSVDRIGDLLGHGLGFFVAAAPAEIQEKA